VHALLCLDLAVPIAADNLRLRQARASLRWQLGRYTAELLDDLAQLARHGDRDERLTALKRSAEVHLSHGNPAEAAKDLYAANQLAPGDLDVLWSYLQCWRELGQTAEAGQTRAEALRRIGRMEAAQMLTTKEADGWRSRFDEPD
jgi:tetratricopeptide (TPR) repeat protein